VEAAVSDDLDAVIITLGDQPLISPRILNALISTYQETGKPVVASRYAGVAGVPALFAKELFPELLQLPPSSGCKGLIEAHASQSALIDCPEGELDIDTRDDYARANPQAD
jgi:molybdenum cofactor cytidylyltransferase